MTDDRYEVVVTDVRVRFWSMVLLLVEWALAAIPAVIILYVAVAAVTMTLDTLFGPAWHWWTARVA